MSVSVQAVLELYKKISEWRKIIPVPEHEQIVLFNFHKCKYQRC